MKKEDCLPQALLDHLHDGVCFVDRQMRITGWNAAAERMTGYSAEEMIGRRCTDERPAHLDREGNRLSVEGRPLAATLEDGRVREAALFLQQKNGRRRPVAVRSVPVLDDDGTIAGAVEIFCDAAGGSRDEPPLSLFEEQALIDSLTGLGNRQFVGRHLEARIEELRRYGAGFGVLFIDIDLFEKLRESNGTAAADRVLHMVGQTVAGNLRPFDAAGRWGEKAFLAVLANVDGHALSIIAERVRMLVDASRLGIDSGILRVTVSIGAVMAGEEDSAETIVERAEQLMYQSKISGRNQVSVGY